MSEANAKKEGAEKKEQPKGKKPAAAADAINGAKKKKEPWTLEKCIKSARRFHSEAEWSAGAPASYKSAFSHGWVKQCVGAMSGTGAKSAKAPVRKSA